jgi:hypothetical protein
MIAQRGHINQQILNLDKNFTQVLLIPGCKRGAVVSAFEEYAADSGDFRHRCLHPRKLSLPIATQRRA